MTGRNGEHQEGFCCMNIRHLELLQPSSNCERYILNKWMINSKDRKGP